MKIYIGISAQSGSMVVFICYCGASSQKLLVATIHSLTRYTN
jgi:hypothetical protein